jgi:hypothetical protein
MEPRGTRETFVSSTYAPPPPPAPAAVVETSPCPPAPPPINSIVLLEEFQSEGTVQVVVVVEVRKITVEALACLTPNENIKNTKRSIKTLKK